MQKISLVILDFEYDDIGEPFELTDEMRQNPQLILNKIDEVVGSEDEEDKEDTEDEEDEED